MESNINRTVFLEFYGLPGCGKSTISHLVANRLRKKGKRVLEPTYDIDHKYSKFIRRIKKIYNALVFCVVFPHYTTSLTNVIKQNGYKGKELISQFINISHKIQIYHFARADYIVFDEGIVQSSISLTQTNKCTVDSINNLNSLLQMCPNRKIKSIDVRVSIEDALNRITKRTKHDSRIEKIENSNDRKKALVKFNQQCNNVISHRRSIIINSSMRSAETAASIIISRI